MPGEGPRYGWMARLGMVVLGSVLQSLAYEPYGQAWLAWVAWVPLLLVLRSSGSLWAAFGWGWLAGALFFAMNLWWLWVATIPGMLALIIYYGLHWAVFTTAVRGLGLLKVQGGMNRDVPPGWSSGGSVPQREWQPEAAILIAIFWVALEWLRAYGLPGFPWMLAGHSQSSLPVLCQISDMGGVFGISFCLMFVNALVFFAIVRWPDRRRAGGCIAMAAAAILAVTGYGIFRMSENSTYRGPHVMVVQLNHPHLPGGGRTVSMGDAAGLYIKKLGEELESQSPDLVVLPEAAMPPLNPEARKELQSSPGGQVIDKTDRLLRRLTAGARTSLVAGANYVGGWIQDGNARVGTEIRNSVYLYRPDGRQSALRYDKANLVAFAEQVAFRESAPWLHRMLLWLAPPVARQQLVAGDRKTPVVFTLERTDRRVNPGAADKPVPDNRPPTPFRFVTPICLENIDSGWIAEMLRDSRGDGKRADFLVNVSNDGWFHPLERTQHFQNIVFRSIENRVPTARASNTGISGFIDSMGRVVQAVPAGTEAAVTGQLMLDRRVTFYTRHGDLFAGTCTLIAGVVILARTAVFVKNRKREYAGG